MSVIHEETKVLIERLSRDTPQSLLLTGPLGIGLLYVASLVSKSSPSTTVIEPETTPTTRKITVERIRGLYQETRSKSTSKQFVIVHEADAMTSSAQTAFLKLLEEPGTNVYFILTSHQPDTLLPTILSRVQQHAARPITLRQSDEYLTALGVTDATKRQQLLFIASGLPEELRHLVDDDVYFDEAAQRIKDARDLLQSNTFDKLLIVNKYKDNRKNALLLVRSMIKITRRSLSQHVQPSLVKQLERLLEVEEALLANYNVRLQLTQYVI